MASLQKPLVHPDDTPAVAWCRRLTLPAALAMLGQRRLRRLPELRYRKATRAGLAALALLRRCGGVAARPVARWDHPDPANLAERVSSGAGVWWTAYVDWSISYCNAIWRRLAARHDVPAAWPNPRSRERVMARLRHLLTEELRHTLTIAAMARFRNEQAGRAAAQGDVLLVSALDWGHELRPLLAADGVSAVVVRDSYLVELAGSLARRVLRRFGRAPAPAARTAAAPQPERVEAVLHTGPKLTVHYSRGLDRQRRSDLAWYDEQQWAPEEIAISCETAAYRLTRQDLATIRERGWSLQFRLPDLLDPDLHATHPVWQAGARSRQLSRRMGSWWWRLLARGWGRAYWWQLGQLYFLGRNCCDWQEYYEHLNTRLDVRMQMQLVEPIMTLDELGGISCCIQWSHGLLLLPGTVLSYHVLFCWGPGYGYLATPLPQNADYLVYCGHPFMDQMATARPEGQAIRARLAAAGATFCLAVYDEAEHTPPEFALGFARLCVKHPDLGVIVKPKRATAEGAAATALQEAVAQAMATGRYLVLGAGVEQERTRVNNLVMPTVAAFAADLAVVADYSSAGIEAAYFGVPAIYWNVHGRTDPLIPRDSRLSFETWAEIEAVIEARLVDSAACPGVGDHREILPLVDPFQDGQAGRRIGDFLHDAFTQLKAGRSRDEALAYAVGRYRAQWGEDKVVQRGQASV